MLPFIVLPLGTDSAFIVYLWLHHQAAAELHRDACGRWGGGHDLIFKKKHSFSKFSAIGVKNGLKYIIKFAKWL